MQISPTNLYYTKANFTGLFSRFKTKNQTNPKTGATKEYLAYKNAMLDGQVSHSGMLFNRHGTLFFRPDLNWAEFGEYLENKFSNCDKVQTLIWGCSGGEEAYSLAILLKHCFGEDSKKFFPIQAMDINSKLIEKNKIQQQTGFSINGGMVIDPMARALKKPSLKFDNTETEKYFRPVSLSEYRIKDDVLDSVNFSFSNILTDLQKIDSDTPALVMCRNMWPYINSEKYNQFAKNLYERLPKGSVVVIGGYDWEGEKCIKDSDKFPAALQKNGFKQVKNFNVTDEYRNPVENTSIVFEKC